MKRAALIWLPLGLFAIFLILVSIGLERPGEKVVTSKMIGKALPAFALPPGASGQPGLATKSFSDGKVRLLNIFASWCVPCAGEAPQLGKLAQQGVLIEGIAVRDAREDVDGFLRRYGNPYAHIGLDARSAVQFNLGSSGVPETYVIDGKGIIRYQHIGAINAVDVPVILEKIAEAGR